jgi:uncharacterized protein YbcV (DUF1398 family)
MVLKPMSLGQPTDVLVLSQICAANPAVEAAVQSIHRGEILYPEFLCRIRAAGCVGYFMQIAGRRVHYAGRTGDIHVEPFAAARA